MSDFTLSAQLDDAYELASANRLEQALARCQRILRAYPKHVRTYGVLGRIYLQLGLHDTARDLFQRVLSADPENALAYASLGAIERDGGRPDEAIWQFERAYELVPANAQVRTALQALYYQRSGDEALHPRPNRASLARTYLRGYLYDRAITEIKSLLREQPDRQDLRVALAEALWQEERYDEAEVICQAILVDLPNSLKANLILGRIWLDSERDEEARALLQRAQALDPENKVAQELFGARSPLPPRVIRLALDEEDAVAPDLPSYLQPEKEPE